MNKEEKIKLDHIEEMIEQAKNKCSIYYTDFIPPSLWPVIEEKLSASDFIIEKIILNQFCEYGILAMHPEYVEVFENDIPIEVLKIEMLNQTNITHRDVLGAVMNQGIKREKIGDIFIKDNDIYLIVMENMAQYIKNNLVKIKNSAVSIKGVDFEKIKDFTPNYKEKIISGNSLRFDLVLSKVFSLSRSDVQRMFLNNKVKRNHLMTNKYKTDLDEGDIVSLRGHGRFKLVEVLGTTRKGNIQIKVNLFY
ncbi:MAG: YlmH/Sll1252 family protein [Bacillota bacterium]|nr:YlmH/Sll1252 family protein [Bacillota bacterium]